MPDDARTDEEFESFPWEGLVIGESRRRSRWISVVAVSVVVLAVSASAARTLWPRSSTPVAVPTTPTATTLAAAPEPATPATTAVPPPAVYSEADLLAVDPADAGRAVGAFGAWFVADYFTLDGTSRAGLADRLASDVALPPVTDGARSFVESADPIEVRQLAPDRYAVTLLIRSLAADGEDAYVRQPARAVEVTVIQADSGMAVADLPRPVPVPASADVAAGPAIALVAPAELPAGLLSAARDQAAPWGVPDADPVEVGRAGEAFRVVFTVRDGSGIGWPLAVWVDGAGDPVPAGG